MNILETLKLARQALEQTATDLHHDNFETEEAALVAIDFAIEELEKQEQGEPVAWVNLDDLYDLEAGEDGDVPYVVRGNKQPKNMPKSIPLYTTPQPAPQGEARGLSQQKPLTDEQIETLWHEDANCNMPADLNEFRHSIKVAEAAHGIKERNT